MSLEDLFRKRPELRTIAQAIEEYFSRKPISARCIKCGGLLKVDHFEIQEMAKASTWVYCENGCTQYHSSGRLNASKE